MLHLIKAISTSLNTKFCFSTFFAYTISLLERVEMNYCLRNIIEKKLVDDGAWKLPFLIILLCGVQWHILAFFLWSFIIEIIELLWKIIEKRISRKACNISTFEINWKHIERKYRKRVAINCEWLKKRVFLQLASFLWFNFIAIARLFARFKCHWNQKNLTKSEWNELLNWKILVLKSSPMLNDTTICPYKG